VTIFISTRAVLPTHDLNGCIADFIALIQLAVLIAKRAMVRAS